MPLARASTGGELLEDKFWKKNRYHEFGQGNATVNAYREVASPLQGKAVLIAPFQKHFLAIRVAVPRMSKCADSVDVSGVPQSWRCAYRQVFLFWRQPRFRLVMITSTKY